MSQDRLLVLPKSLPIETVQESGWFGADVMYMQSEEVPTLSDDERESLAPRNRKERRTQQAQARRTR